VKLLLLFLSTLLSVTTVFGSSMADSQKAMNSVLAEPSIAKKVNETAYWFYGIVQEDPEGKPIV